MTISNIHPLLKIHLDDASAVELVIAKAIGHAEVRLRSYYWRDQHTLVSLTNALSASGYTASDFVSEAFGKLIQGHRTYNENMDLLNNIKQVINSLIYNHVYGLENRSFIDTNVSVVGATYEIVDSGPTPSETQIADEVSTRRCELYECLKDHVSSDREISEVLTAIEMEVTKSGDIADLLGFQVQKVYECKRKLKKRAKSYFGIQKYDEFEHRLDEGSL